MSAASALPGAAGDSRWRWRAAALAILVLAGALRWLHLGAHELWLDEAYSYQFATLHDWLHYVRADLNPPLYYGLLRLWTAVAGTSEAALRLPSALAGLVLVGATMCLARSIVDREAALWAGLVAATSPMAVYYSQEARGYALAIALALVAAVALWRAWTSGAWAGWIAAGILAGLALDTHWFASLTLAGAVLATRAGAGPLPRALAPRAGAAAAIALAAAVPWVAWRWLPSGAVPTGMHAVSWIAQQWRDTPPLLAMPRSLELFVLGAQAGLRVIYLKQLSFIDFAPSLRAVGLGAATLLALVAFAPARAAGLRGGPGDRARRALPWLLLPLPVLWLVSWYEPLYLVGRYDQFAFPAWPLIAGLGFARARAWRTGGRLAVVALAAALLVPVAWKLYRYYTVPATGSERRLAALLDTSVANGEVVAYTGMRGVLTLYYLARRGYRWTGRTCEKPGTTRRFACRFYPASTGERLTYDPSLLLAHPKAVGAETDALLRARAPGARRLWLVLDGGVLAGGKYHPSAVDGLLVHALEARGYRPRRTPVARVFTFAR